MCRETETRQYGTVPAADSEAFETRVEGTSPSSTRANLLGLPTEMRCRIRDYCDERSCRAVSQCNRTLAGEFIHKGHLTVHEDFLKGAILCKATRGPRENPRALQIRTSVKHVLQSNERSNWPSMVLDSANEVSRQVQKFRRLRQDCPMLESYQLCGPSVTGMSDIAEDTEWPIIQRQVLPNGEDLAVFKHTHLPELSATDIQRSRSDDVLHSAPFQLSTIRGLHGTPGIEQFFHGVHCHSFRTPKWYASRDVPSYPSQYNLKVLQKQIDLMQRWTPQTTAGRVGLQFIDQCTLVSGNYSEHLQVLSRLGLSPESSVGLRRLGESGSGVPSVGDLLGDESFRSAMEGCPFRHICLEVSNVCIPTEWTGKRFPHSPSTRRIDFLLSVPWTLPPYYSQANVPLDLLDSNCSYRVLSSTKSWQDAQRRYSSESAERLRPPDDDPILLENICANLPEPVKLQALIESGSLGSSRLRTEGRSDTHGTADTSLALR